MKRFFAVLLVFSLLCVTGVVSLSVSGIKVTEESALTNKADNIKASRFETMLNINYAFSDDFSSVSKILDNVLISLLPHSEKGVLENSVIIDFTKNMYGIDPSILCDEGSQTLLREGKTAIPAKGFVSYSHTVTKVIKNDDGTFTVYSTVKSSEFESVTNLEAISRFAVSTDSNFGYILLSCELLLPETQATASFAI